MLNALVAVCLTAAAHLASAIPTEATPVAAPRLWLRTRPLSTDAAALLRDAALRSAIVEDLLEKIEGTDLVVYVSEAMPGVFTGAKSSMVLLSGDTANRYLLIRVDGMRLAGPERIAALGHELHHALEVAQAPEVREPSDMAALYRRIGWETSRGRFESAGAQAVGYQVAKQLRGRGRGERIARAPDGVAPTAVGGPSLP